MQVYASVKTEGERDVQVSDVIKLLKARHHSADIEEILGEDTDYDTGRKLAQDFVQRSGLRSLPQVRSIIGIVNAVNAKEAYNNVSLISTLFY